jgi:hypothetical protein
LYVRSKRALSCERKSDERDVSFALGGVSCEKSCVGESAAALYEDSKLRRGTGRWMWSGGREASFPSAAIFRVARARVLHCDNSCTSQV